MAINPDTGRFEWTEFQDTVFSDITEKLGNTERGQLRALADPGGPLWYVQEAMVAYATVLEKAIAGCDFATIEGLARARQLQTEFKAVRWQRELWERILSPLPEVTEEKSK